MAKDMKEFLAMLAKDHPGDILSIDKEVNPATFDATALMQHLENQALFPVVHFKNPLNLHGKPSQFTAISNMFCTRKRNALAMGLRPDQSKLPLSLEYAKRVDGRVAPVVIPKSEAPVKEVIKIGDQADLYEFPHFKFHYMDGGPYQDMTPITRDPENGSYNVAFLRQQVKGPRKLGLHMSPRHNWTHMTKNEKMGKNTPVVITVGHHPAFYMGALNVCPFGTDDYEVIGSIMGEPLRLTPSETWGDAFMVPADAEILVEGEILANVREQEGPFGEFTGYFGPERVRWVIDVKAITYRKNAIYQCIFTGHRDVSTVGAIPKEGTLYSRIKGQVPTVQAVHFPYSGTGRFHCYVSIDKKVDGSSKQAALIAMGECDFVKNVIVVDKDIDVFNETDVMFAFATRFQADEDLDIIKNLKGNTLDPSLPGDIMSAKTIIDATKPVGKPFAERIRVPDEALNRVKLADYVSTEAINKLSKEV